MFRYQSSGKSQTCYSLLRSSNRTKTSSSSTAPKFERDAAPHSGLAPRPTYVRPRALTYRPKARVDPTRSQQVRRRPPWPVSSTSTWKPQSTPVNTSLAIDEFYHPPQSVSAPSNSRRQSNLSDDKLPSEFNSPPLLPELHKSLLETLGPFARPTPIQSLSLKWILQDLQGPPSDQPNWRQFFLASETGSGKSIAYLLPLLQSLKQAEIANKGEGRTQSNSNRLYNPRALILAPTHELSRQLSTFAKSLLHELKLRVLCASQANTSSAKSMQSTSRKMASMFDDVGRGGESDVSQRGRHGVDVLVGTPMKLLEMFRGRWWDNGKEQEKEEENDDDEASVDEEIEKKRPRRGRDFAVGMGKAKTVELGLQNVEWVVIDEADVLLDPDFQATTRLLLSDISEARGHPIPLTPVSDLEKSPEKSLLPPAYPFNLIFTSATIPNSLNNYLQNHHPSLLRLSSPDLHHLPKTLKTEYSAWSGGNKFADIHRRIRQIWAEDAASAPDKTGKLSKVLIFCNKSEKVIELSTYLEEQGVLCVPMTSSGEHRRMGSNRHLTGFLKTPSIVETMARKKLLKQARTGLPEPDPSSPLVMVTTSLLSRGLDFTPEVKHVFIVDSPRNMVDFLHRAGRSGRAGQKGKVIVFGKLKEGRGEVLEEMKKKFMDLKKRFGVAPNPSRKKREVGAGPGR